jgi:hypothetical protein
MRQDGSTSDDPFVPFDGEPRGTSEVTGADAHGSHDFRPVDPWPEAETVTAPRPVAMPRPEPSPWPGPNPWPELRGMPAEPEPVEPEPVEPAPVEPQPVDAVDTSDPSGDEPTQVLGPGPPPAPELPEPMDGAEAVRRMLRPPRRGPLRRFTLYASGADTRVLHLAPVDESEFIVQGSLVILTAIVAGVSGLAAAGFLTTGRFVLSPVTVLVGLVWGLLIFYFDRALVSGSLNPYRFTQAEVNSLRDAGVDSPWAHLIDVSGGRRGALRRAGEVVRVSAVASLRVALALATSYIAAEMVLFLVFQPEVNARTAYLQRQLQDQRIASIQAEFQAESAKRAEQRTQLGGASDAEVGRLTGQRDELTTQLEAARKDLGVLQAAAAAEADGDRYRGRLSDGTVVTTTGDRGIAAAARSLAQRRDNQQNIVNDLSGRLARTRNALDARLAEIKREMGPALTALDQVDNEAAADHEAALRAARADPSAITGLLLRQAALDKLEHDLRPETLADDPIPPCTGPFAWFCVIRNWVVAPTPMGPTVAAYRIIFFVIEILPITYKVLTSLRRRRPYDVIKAALEESNNIDAIRLLDRHLHDAAGEVLTRSGQRRQHWQAGAHPAATHVPRSRHTTARPDLDRRYPESDDRPSSRATRPWR